MAGVDSVWGRQVSDSALEEGGGELNFLTDIKWALLKTSSFGAGCDSLGL